MITAGEKIKLRAEFTLNGSLHDAGEPVNFYVKKRDKDATKEGPFLGTRKSEGVWEYLYTTSEAGKFDYSVVSSDGVIEEGEFVVKRRRTV